MSDIKEKDVLLDSEVNASSEANEKEITKVTDNTDAEVVTAPKRDYESEILEIIRGTYSPRVILSKIEDYHENDIAQVFSVLQPQERKKFFRICNSEMLAAIFEYVEEDEAAVYLRPGDRYSCKCASSD